MVRLAKYSKNSFVSMPDASFVNRLDLFQSILHGLDKFDTQGPTFGFYAAVGRCQNPVSK